MLNELSDDAKPEAAAEKPKDEKMEAPSADTASAADTSKAADAPAVKEAPGDSSADKKVEAKKPAANDNERERLLDELLNQ